MVNFRIFPGLILATGAGLVTAQTPSSNNPSSRSSSITSSPAPSPTLSPLNGSSFAPISAVVSSSISSSTNITTNSTTIFSGPHLDTKLDATFGILGGMLVITGVPTAFYGSRNRWSSFFFCGIYTGAMVVGLLILHFGVVGAIKDPPSTTRGLFLFASLAAGIITGAVSIVFWKGAQHLCCAMGGFSIGLFLLCVRSDSLIRPVGLRYILLIGLAAVGFAQSTIVRLTPNSVLVATSALGSSAIVLGVDCFTSSQLKEFYVYNVGLSALFPKLDGHFTQSLGIQIELGVMAALFLSGIAAQLRFHDLLVSKAKELREADKARNAQEEEASRKLKHLSIAELNAWEEKWGNSRGGQSPSSTTALMQCDSLDLEQQRSRTTSVPIFQRPSSSIDFLPQIDFGGGGMSPLGRQDTLTPKFDSHGVDWESYFASRKLGTALKPTTTVPARRDSAFLSRHNLAPFPTVNSENDLEDLTPIGLLQSPSSVTRPGRFPSLPTRPSSLAFVNSAPDLGGDGRRKTMIDLTTGSDGSQDRPARQRTSTAERIIVGGWTPASKAVPVPLPTAQVMEYSQLDSKHRRRISELQAPVTSVVKTEAEIAAAQQTYELRKQREASEMKQKEKDREGASRTRTSSGKRMSSIGRISGLIDKIASTSSAPVSPHPPSQETFSRNAPRRRSLGALLEESPVKGSVYERREDRRDKGLSRVTAWQAEGTTPEAPKNAGKHSWLGY